MSLLSKTLILVVVSCFVFTAYVIDKGHTNSTVMTLYNVKILHESGAYGYWMTLEDKPADPPFFAVFCANEVEPPFGEGEVLNYLAVDNFTDCWSIKSDRAHYLMRRNPDGTLFRFKQGTQTATAAGPSTAR